MNEVQVKPKVVATWSNKIFSSTTFSASKLLSKTAYFCFYYQLILTAILATVQLNLQ